jgi:CPA1 family monovalent cation:H+ antiporter
VFLFIFLPALLFQGALEVDTRDLAGDAVPIFTMAVVAVIVATLAIGFALAPVSGAPLILCLLVGAIVATTDPSAVIAIFRDLGAPQRLTRLVEGESLLNDAVAITLFAIILQYLTTGHGEGIGATALRVVIAPLGGGAVGFVAARAVAAMFSLVGENRLVQVSLTLALPYLVFVAAEHWRLSGPVAVAAAGLTLSGAGPSRISPSAWRYLKDVWGQLAFWAGSMVFILAAILIPRLMHGFGSDEIGAVAMLTVTALAARAVVLFGFMPLLTALKISPPISTGFRAVMLWGGLRGAVTLALALAVTEHATLPEETKRFVAVLATSFVLFTLLVQGTTLRPLMRMLGLDRLSAVDQTLRERALELSHAEVCDAIEQTARDYALGAHLAAEIAAEYRRSDDGRAALAIGEDERRTLALAALAAREQDLILEHLEHKTVSPGLVSYLLAKSRRLLDAARLAGAAGYVQEARAALAFSWRTRFANLLHWRLGVHSLLERQLATRFEILLVDRIVINGLESFANRQLAALYGAAAGEEARAALAERGDETTRSLEALRLQYPDYAEDLERRFLRMSALRREQDRYERLHDEGLIGQEVRRALIESILVRARADRRPKLDLRLDTRVLVSSVPLFGNLDDAQLDDVCRLMKPAFAIPGQRLITAGERGDAAWFIASGAVEVEARHAPVRLGRGDFFGELALLTGAPRTANVTAIAFCELLVLYARDFRNLLAANAAIRAEIEEVAAERLGLHGAVLDAARV